MPPAVAAACRGGIEEEKGAQEELPLLSVLLLLLWGHQVLGLWDCEIKVLLLLLVVVVVQQCLVLPACSLLGGLGGEGECTGSLQPVMEGEGQGERHGGLAGGGGGVTV